MEWNRKQYESLSNAFQIELCLEQQSTLVILRLAVSALSQSEVNSGSSKTHR